MKCLNHIGCPPACGASYHYLLRGLAAGLCFAMAGHLSVRSENPPALTIQRGVGQTVIISWPETAPDYVLEQAVSIDSGSPWHPVQQAPELANQAYALATQANGTHEFFRLQNRQTNGPTQVRIIKLPDNALVPDVGIDKNGIVHLVYGLNHNAYYVRSTNNGATFTPAVKVNSTGTVETEMGERGPKLAVGADSVIHVIWADDWAPGVQCYVRYGRSVDGGRSFSARQTVSAMSGVDGVTLTADGVGNVLAFWHVMTTPQPDVPQATWLHLARSTNNGVSFGNSDKLKIVDLAGIACSMCMMRARIGRDGAVYLVFRNAENNVRDFYVLKSPIAQNNFAAVRVNQDNWSIDFCPMNGPELTWDANGRALCAFMSRNKVYWAISDVPMTRFDLHVATPANEQNEIYPTAIANRKGEVLFIWQIGSMSTSGTATVKWALYTSDGKFMGRQGVVGTSFSGTKATGFVGTDDHFYLLTTAKTP